MATFAGSLAPIAALPVRRTPRAAARMPAICRATSQNEVAEAQTPTEPTVFYGGNSYSESEVRPYAIELLFVYTKRSSFERLSTVDEGQQCFCARFVMHFFLAKGKGFEKAL